jgi:hypothetical protein
VLNLCKLRRILPSLRYITNSRFAKELDQWLKKMKCSGATGQRLENFRDIKVGINNDEVDYRSPSLEPFPNLKNEVFTFKGGRDHNGLFKVRIHIVQFQVMTNSKLDDRFRARES